MNAVNGAKRVAHRISSPILRTFWPDILEEHGANCPQEGALRGQGAVYAGVLELEGAAPRQVREPLTK